MRVAALSRPLLAGVVATLLAGCGENLHSIFRQYSLDDRTTVVTDAKQRVILNIPKPDESGVPNSAGKFPERRVVCAEPSPDIAQALSEAFRLSGSADIAKPGAMGTASQAFGLDLARSSSASIAQLGERLATIQLLRDKMYRACEAYANGAVARTGYTLMLARLDKTMVTLLSNEMAAGAFGRGLAQIGSSASSGGVSTQTLRDAEARVNDKSKILLDLAKQPAPAAEPDKGNQEKALTKAREDLEKAIGELVALDRAFAVVAASAPVNGSNGLGTISQRSAGLTGETIAAIHQTYIDDDGVEPLVDACITAMDSVSLKGVTSTGLGERLQFAEVRRAQDDRDEKELRELRDKRQEVTIRLASAESDYRRFKEEAEGLRTKEKPSNDDAARLTRTQDILRDIEGFVARVKAERDGFDSKIQELQEGIKRRAAEAAQNLNKDDLSDRIIEAFIQGGSTFSAFCYQNVLSQSAPYMLSRGRAKQELRKLTVPVSAQDQALSTCVTVLGNPEVIKAMATDKLTSPLKELATSCVDRIKLPPKEKEENKPTPVSTKIEVKNLQ